MEEDDKPKKKGLFGMLKAGNRSRKDLGEEEGDEKVRGWVGRDGCSSGACLVSSGGCDDKSFNSSCSPTAVRPQFVAPSFSVTACFTNHLQMEGDVTAVDRAIPVDVQAPLADVDTAPEHYEKVLPGKGADTGMDDPDEVTPGMDADVEGYGMESLEGYALEQLLTLFFDRSVEYLARFPGEPNPKSGLGADLGVGGV